MALETITDNLRDGCKQLVSETFLHVDRLLYLRWKNLELRDQCFYTADGQGYFPNYKDVEWAITREPDNLVLRHLNDKVNSSYGQLTKQGNYRPDNAEALAAKNAPDTVVVPMGRLRLSGEDNEWRYLGIRTVDGFIRTENGYQRPNKVETKVMNRLGYTSKILEVLDTAKIAETGIVVLNPDYVREEVGKDPEHNSLWRASWLDYFGNYSYFYAYGRDVGLRGRLRGVRRQASVSEQDAPQAHALKEALDLERNIRKALDAQQPFEYNGVVYAPVRGVKLK